MIIHRTYSEEGTEIVHIPCVPSRGFCRLVWGDSGMYCNHLSVKGIAKLGRKVKGIPKEPNAHS